jgi:adenine-specific DNA-methyltransferase
LVINNIYEWFIFNSNDFVKLFADYKGLVKQFPNFEEGKLSGTNTDFFYKNIPEPFISKSDLEISFIHFDIRDFETAIKNAERKDENQPCKPVSG